MSTLAIAYVTRKLSATLTMPIGSPSCTIQTWPFYEGLQLHTIQMPQRILREPLRLQLLTPEFALFREWLSGSCNVPRAKQQAPYGRTAPFDLGHGVHAAISYRAAKWIYGHSVRSL